MINLDASTFAEKITEKDVVLLDVRTFDEFSQTHIRRRLILMFKVIISPLM